MSERDSLFQFLRWAVGLSFGAVGVVFGLASWGFLEAFDRITPAKETNP